MNKVLIKLTTLVSVFVSSSAFASFINYLDMSVENVGGYDLVNVSHSMDEKGNLLGIYRDSITASSTEEIANFKVNFLGQLSQNLKLDVVDANAIKVGQCTIHIGIGSYMAKPDFTGSSCTMNNGDYLQINPWYQIANNTYKTHYKITKSKSFSRVIIFGDSMSDNGNLYKRSVELSLIFPISPILPVSPPYYKGRFTNGKVWVELLSKKLNIPEGGLLDYAYAGASVKQDFLPVPNLDKQVSKYLNWNLSGDPYALYIVWIGSNDLLRNKSTDNNEVTNTILNGVKYNLQRLIEHGAKHILVPQLPDLSVTPDSIEIDVTNGHNNYSQRLKNLAANYNFKLKKQIKLLAEQNPSVKFMTYDVFEFLESAHDNADEYGFKYIHERCNPNSYWDDEQATCHTPRQYVFWDGLHPSATAHSILAEMMYKVVTESGYEPNIIDKGIKVKALLPDEFTLRNHKAISELQTEIGSAVQANGKRSYSAASESLSIITERNIPLF